MSHETKNDTHINEVPLESTETCRSHYTFPTSRGDLTIQMPASIKTSDFCILKMVFELVLKQAERSASE